MWAAELMSHVMCSDSTYRYTEHRKNDALKVSPQHSQGTSVGMMMLITTIKRR